MLSGLHHGERPLRVARDGCCASQGMAFVARGLFSRLTDEGIIDLHLFVLRGLFSRPTSEGVIDLHDFIVCGLFSRPTNEGVVD